MADELKAFLPAAWKTFAEKFPKDTALVCDSFPTNVGEEGVLRFIRERGQWFRSVKTGSSVGWVQVLPPSTGEIEDGPDFWMDSDFGDIAGWCINADSNSYIVGRFAGGRDSSSAWYILGTGDDDAVFSGIAIENVGSETDIYTIWINPEIKNLDEDTTDWSEWCNNTDNVKITKVNPKIAKPVTTTVTITLEVQTVSGYSGADKEAVFINKPSTFSQYPAVGSTVDMRMTCRKGIISYTLYGYVNGDGSVPSPGDYFSCGLYIGGGVIKKMVNALYPELKLAKSDLADCYATCNYPSMLSSPGNTVAIVWDASKRTLQPQVANGEVLCFYSGRVLSVLEGGYNFGDLFFSGELDISNILYKNGYDVLG